MATSAAEIRPPQDDSATLMLCPVSLSSAPTDAASSLSCDMFGTSSNSCVPEAIIHEKLDGRNNGDLELRVAAGF